MFSRRACPTSIIACLAGASQAGPRSSRRGRSDGHAGYLVAGSALGSSVASPHTRGPILPGTRNFWDPCMSSACVLADFTLATVCKLVNGTFMAQCYRVVRKPPSREQTCIATVSMKGYSVCAGTHARTKATTNWGYLRSTWAAIYNVALPPPSLFLNPHPSDLPDWSLGSRYTSQGLERQEVHSCAFCRLGADALRG